MDSSPVPDKTTDAGKPARSASAMGARAISTFGLWALVVGMFLWGSPWAYVILVGGMTMLGTWEYHGIARKAGILPMPILGMLGAGMYTAVLFFYLFHGRIAETHVLDTAAFALFLGVGFFLRLLGPVDGTRSVIGLAVALLGFVYLAFGMNFVARVIFFGYPGSGTPPQAWLGLWLVAVTKFTDVGAYLVGSAIGKNKLIPHISPGKTREGLLGAVLFSQVAGCGLYAAYPHELALLGGWPTVVLLGLVLAAAAVIGDLAESLVKRSLAIKDSGNSLPGIGGVLDLIDSLCFTAPILYFYLRLSAASGIGM